MCLPLHLRQFWLHLRRSHDLNRDCDEQIGDNRPFGQLAIALVGTPVMIPVFGVGGEPNGVEDVLWDDDNDVEPTTIDEDSDNDLGRSIPIGGGGTSISETQVLESDHCKNYRKCKDFDNGCTWLIRITLHQWKGIWEVRRYNGSHTCLATSISSDRRMLDYHAIFAFILLMIRADAAMLIKITMPGSVVVLKTSPVRLGVQVDESSIGVQVDESSIGVQVDESSTYFHWLFWTFPPCIEAFRYCKSLVSIGRTHLYGKYGDTLMIAVAQDRNSNIISIAFVLVEGILVISDRHNGIKAALGIRLVPTKHFVFDTWQQVLP
ncbi:uncharacterized protein LOC107636181 [Arachis ipaensis]|uniref:uncharacterized protein LOC107636181 n=1 Tax=Arachis ipaensis TaxID=130454 RepID=UPI0007AF2DED|nr:uncharacterized protein LOC107636181 [Arachis ipaensis]